MECHHTQVCSSHRDLIRFGVCRVQATGTVDGTFCVGECLSPQAWAPHCALQRFCLVRSQAAGTFDLCSLLVGELSPQVSSLCGWRHLRVLVGFRQMILSPLVQLTGEITLHSKFSVVCGFEFIIGWTAQGSEFWVEQPPFSGLRTSGFA